jgi:hypothetical protein
MTTQIPSDAVAPIMPPENPPSSSPLNQEPQVPRAPERPQHHSGGEAPWQPEKTFDHAGLIFTYQTMSATSVIGSYQDGPGLPVSFSICLDVREGKPNAMISCVAGETAALGLLALAHHMA